MFKKKIELFAFLPVFPQCVLFAGWSLVLLLRKHEAHNLQRAPRSTASFMRLLH